VEKQPKPLRVGEMQISIFDFLESYNKNIPKSFPSASIQLLQKFQEAHANLFKNRDMWSLEQHRKRVMDWLPRSI
jgi:hypothetical protein